MTRVGVLVLVALLGCRSRDVDPRPPPGGTRVDRPGPLPIDEADFLRWLRAAAPDAPVFQIDGQIVAAGPLQRIAEQLRADDPTATDAILATRVKAALDDRLETGAMLALATHRGVTPAPDEVAAKLATLTVDHPERDPVEAEARARTLVAIDQLIAQALTPDDTTLGAWLLAHPDPFRFADAVRVDGVLLGGRDAATWRRAQDLARELAGLDAAEFHARAARFSSVAMPATGAWAELATFPPEVSRVLAATPVGAVAGPLVTPTGAAILRVDARLTGEPPPLADIHDAVLAAWQDEARPTIRAQLRAEAYATLEVRWLL